MKLKLLDYLRADEPIVIASFGGAQIVRHLDGRYELRGGTPDDHTAAREWASMFMHTVTLGGAGGQQWASNRRSAARGLQG